MLGIVAAAQVSTEPTVETRTFTNVVTFTVPTETVVSTVTVTQPTTTAAPTTTTAPPASQPDVIVNDPNGVGWVCTGPQDRNLVRITNMAAAADAIQLRNDCQGRIGRIEVSGRFQDCIKINPVAPEPHDLRVDSGFCRATGPPIPAEAHQDCVQAGGGDRITFRNFVFDCVGGGGGNYFIASFNGGTPDRIICDHCAFGPRHPNQIRTPSDPDSGVLNSLVCQSESGRVTFSPASGDKGGNIVPPAPDPSCSFVGLQAYAGGTG